VGEPATPTIVELSVAPGADATRTTLKTKATPALSGSSACCYTITSCTITCLRFALATFAPFRGAVALMLTLPSILELSVAPGADATTMTVAEAVATPALSGSSACCYTIASCTVANVLLAVFSFADATLSQAVIRPYDHGWSSLGMSEAMGRLFSLHPNSPNRIYVDCRSAFWEPKLEVVDCTNFIDFIGFPSPPSRSKYIASDLFDTLDSWYPFLFAQFSPADPFAEPICLTTFCWQLITQLRESVDDQVLFVARVLLKSLAFFYGPLSRFLFLEQIVICVRSQRQFPSLPTDTELVAIAPTPLRLDPEGATNTTNLLKLPHRLVAAVCTSCAFTTIADWHLDVRVRVTLVFGLALRLPRRSPSTCCPRACILLLPVRSLLLLPACSLLLLPAYSLLLLPAYSLLLLLPACSLLLLPACSLLLLPACSLLLLPRE